MYARAPFGQLAIADGPAVTTPASLTDATPIPAQEISAYLLNSGGRIFTKIKGRFTSTGTPGTLTIGLYLAKPAVAIGSAVLVVASAALVPLASQTNKTFEAEFETMIVSVGPGGAALGQVKSSGKVVGLVAAGSVDMVPATAPFAAVSFDSGSSHRILVGLTPSVTTGSVTLHSVYSEYAGL